MARVFTKRGWIGYHSQGSGPVIVCIPPPLIGVIAFHHQIADLSRDFRILVHHLPGHGESSFADEKITFETISTDVVALMDALDIRKAVITGYSIGGAVALECLRGHPDRFVAGIPVGAFSEVSDPLLYGLLSFVSKLAAANCSKTLAMAIALANSRSSASIRAMYQASRKAQLPAVAALFRAALAYRATEGVSQIHQPLQLIYGKRDVVLWRYANILARRVPHAETIWIPGIGHEVPSRAPVLFNANIRSFMAQLGLSVP